MRKERWSMIGSKIEYARERQREIARGVSRDEEKFRGWIGNDEDRNNKIRAIIMKILQDNPSGNISPSEVKK